MTYQPSKFVVYQPVAGGFVARLVVAHGETEARELVRRGYGQDLGRVPAPIDHELAVERVS